MLTGFTTRIEGEENYTVTVAFCIVLNAPDPLSAMVSHTANPCSKLGPRSFSEICYVHRGG